MKLPHSITYTSFLNSGVLNEQFSVLYSKWNITYILNVIYNTTFISSKYRHTHTHTHMLTILDCVADINVSISSTGSKLERSELGHNCSLLKIFVWMWEFLSWILIWRQPVSTMLTWVILGNMIYQDSRFTGWNPTEMDRFLGRTNIEPRSWERLWAVGPEPVNFCQNFKTEKIGLSSKFHPAF